MHKEGKRPYRPLIFRVFIITLALAWSAAITAQDDNLDLNFENAPINQIVLDIEAKSGYRFFFIEDWLQDIRASISISGAGLSEVLDALLADSDLNYYVLEDEKRVILVRNTIIYDELPLYFF
ncbi:MAG: FecR domain-containing protein, partial [Kangiellaceae bacterium]|nr:FecR domain-containing protein [Kangiellaceae bacterium]